MATSSSPLVKKFYVQYHGHDIRDLERVHDALRYAAPDDSGRARPIIWLAGDSSFDNKHWFRNAAPACNGMERVLDPPHSKQDIAYWINRLAAERGLDCAAVNCAVEESTVQARACGRLLEQDRFLRDNVRECDTVCVSVGGNDIALAPAPCTIASILALVCCTPRCCIDRCACGCALPIDDCCCGCSSGFLSNCLACPPGLGYLIHLFHVRIQAYVERLIDGACKPRRVCVCMIYYLDEDAEAQSWANRTLSALGYNRDPRKLQAIIRAIFAAATRRIRVAGTEVVAVPLFAALDGSDSADYAARVEPSAAGGRKIADLLLAAAATATGATADGSARPGAVSLASQEVLEQDDSRDYGATASLGTVDGAIAMERLWARIEREHSARP